MTALIIWRAILPQGLPCAPSPRRPARWPKFRRRTTGSIWRFPPLRMRRRSNVSIARSQPLLMQDRARFPKNRNPLRRMWPRLTSRSCRNPPRRIRRPHRQPLPCLKVRMAQPITLSRHSRQATPEIRSRRCSATTRVLSRQVSIQGSPLHLQRLNKRGSTARWIHHQPRVAAQELALGNQGNPLDLTASCG